MAFDELDGVSPSKCFVAENSTCINEEDNHARLFDITATLAADRPALIARAS